MKQIFNKFLIGLVLVLGIFMVSASFVDANIIPLFEETYSPDDFSDGIIGGVTTPITTTTTTEVLPQISLTIDLDKNLPEYEPNSNIQVTSSVIINVCNNLTTSVIVEGVILDSGDTPQTLIERTLPGQIIITGTNIFTAPSTPGSYYLNVQAKNYSLPSYEIYTEDNENYVHLVMNSDGSFFYDSYLLGPLFYQGIDINSFNFFKVNFPITVQNESGLINYIIKEGEYTSLLLSTTEFNIPFTVLDSPSPTVTVYVNDLENPDPIIFGDIASVYWEHSNATNGCICTSNKPIIRTLQSNEYDCGSSGSSGSSIIKSSTFNISGVISQTIFSVSCSN